MRLAGTGELEDGPVRADRRGRLPDDAVLARSSSSATSPTPATSHHASASGAAQRAGPVQADPAAACTSKQLAGIDRAAPAGGCAARRPHDDRHPSCDVSSRPETGWYCHSCCGAGGAIYDLASVLLGGPHGRQLRGEQFKRARAYVADIFGELT